MLLIDRSLEVLVQPAEADYNGGPASVKRPLSKGKSSLGGEGSVT